MKANLIDLEDIVALTSQLNEQRFKMFVAGSASAIEYDEVSIFAFNLSLMADGRGLSTVGDEPKVLGLAILKEKHFKSIEVKGDIVDDALPIGV